MSKNSKHLPDWWLKDEISPSDPWAYIVSDFQWSWNILQKTRKIPFKFQDQEIGHYPEAEGRCLENIEFALNTITKLHDEIICKISFKTLDLEFLRDWGEYQKAIAILEISIPQYDKTKGIRALSKNADKEKSRMWLALWFEWYQAEYEKNRGEFDDFFEEFMCDIRNGNRKTKNENETDEVISLAKSYFKTSQEISNLEKISGKKIDPSEADSLTNNFRQKNFNGSEFRETLEKAKAEKNSLPAVGEEHYPKM